MFTTEGTEGHRGMVAVDNNWLSKLLNPVSFLYVVPSAH